MKLRRLLFMKPFNSTCPGADIAAAVQNMTNRCKIADKEQSTDCSVKFICRGVTVCCRYFIDEDAPEYAGILQELKDSPLLKKWGGKASVHTGGDIRPGDVSAVLAPDRKGERAVFPMKWRYGSRRLLINARAETAAVKPSFREDWVRHRCIVPASWYYEWEHTQDEKGRVRTGKRYRIRAEEGNMTWLCGLYHIEDGLPVFVILTREPGDEIRFIHDRMPLILPGELTDDWIRPETKPEELLRYAQTKMLFAAG